jgi:hypothetical protein
MRFRSRRSSEDNVKAIVQDSYGPPLVDSSPRAHQRLVLLRSMFDFSVPLMLYAVPLDG